MNKNCRTTLVMPARHKLAYYPLSNAGGVCQAFRVDF